jgi:hypothetical protein
LAKTVKLKNKKTGRIQYRPAYMVSQKFKFIKGVLRYSAPQEKTS